MFRRFYVSNWITYALSKKKNRKSKSKSIPSSIFEIEKEFHSIALEIKAGLPQNKKKEYHLIFFLPIPIEQLVFTTNIANPNTVPNSVSIVVKYSLFLYWLLQKLAAWSQYIIIEKQRSEWETHSPIHIHIQIQMIFSSVRVWSNAEFSYLFLFHKHKHMNSGAFQHFIFFSSLHSELYAECWLGNRGIK